MFAAEIPADIHQFDRVERAAATPRRTSRVRAFALEAVEHRYEPGAAPGAPRHAEPAVDVRKERDVHIFEEARANVVRLGADQFLGHARPDPDRARNLFALHDLLQHDRRRDIYGLTGVVAFAMARRPVDHRLAI